MNIINGKNITTGLQKEATMRVVHSAISPKSDIVTDGKIGFVKRQYAIAA